ncbi:indolepyruvate ferredoxin oxidoreductase family protein [Kordiimonas pumila]|uniref:Indolepyruvate ferredoxin oxidoreductase family protein n=1 Tax=Kordiimonas pumila TaxID=2161677 RepID=A0ABV7D580_9PROT|nr:indolepyruvate ferredoxin oxidoreductase family protein [Kordiimonas pumila]
MTEIFPISLNDKYRLEGDRALLNGCQALVRLPLLQRALDQRKGLNTAGYISGYRGSPLGGYDVELWKASAELEQNNIIFQPAVNEDLALTAVFGTQQLDFIPDKTVDGVFSFWYGKGPGVDRSGDAIKHANLHGTSSRGGVVLLYGDDHTGKSSTTAHQSDLTLASWGVPTLYPSSVDEILEMGLAAVAMSRYTGLLVGLKLVNETVETTSVLDLSLPEDPIVPDYPLPEDGVNIRQEVQALQQQDARITRSKLPMAQAFSHANNLDRITFGAESPRFLIATTGKAYTDVLEAISQLSIDEPTAKSLGIGVYKIALIFPLDPAGLAEASRAAEEIFFVEEKRAHAETQAKTLLFNQEKRPRITGKADAAGLPLLPADFGLDPITVAVAIAARLSAAMPDIEALHPGFKGRVIELRSLLASKNVKIPPAVRRPAFCPGCPHNTSTKVPAGSVGSTGIGCHGMVMFQPERSPMIMGHMGAEGANWIGLSNFTETKHIFQNLGDGTYNHSGSLAIRAAVQASTNITYKILYNDAVAMTGGQPVEGGLTVSQIVQQVQAEGVTSVTVLSENPDRFSKEPLPTGTTLRHRDDLDLVQKALRQQIGVSILIYDQVCAAEKRRRRKTGLFDDPDKRIYINSHVCEGCGDCSLQSNCLAIQPLETEIGRKRKIDQSACNKDFSCIKGFCPSFVALEGARIRKSAGKKNAADVTPPALRDLGNGFDMVLAGIGGTGVVTIGAILAMAARIEGLDAHVFDMTGLSQKGGAVFSHLRLRPKGGALVPARVGAGDADMILACDMVAAVHPEVLSTVSKKTLVVGNNNIAATANFQQNRDQSVSPTMLEENLSQAAGTKPFMIPANKIALDACGDTIFANIVALGVAWQSGKIPLSLASINEAIKLNGRSVEANQRAFNAGRGAFNAVVTDEPLPLALNEFIANRVNDLTAFWNEAYAERYASLMATVLSATEGAEGGDFRWAVARSAYKLMAYKDEYEVARLYTDKRFLADLNQQFDTIKSIKLHLSPPLLARINPATGHPRKIAVGGWILPVFRCLAKLRGLREGPFDIFSLSSERRLERALRDTYIRTIEALLPSLANEKPEDALDMARAPMNVRGFGHVKKPHAEALLIKLNEKLQSLQCPR